MSQPSHTTAPADRAQEIRSLRQRLARRPRLALAGLALGLLAALAIRILLGSYTVTLPDFLTILGGGEIPGARGARYIVMEDKLPRALLGTLAGAAFGLAGAIFQLLLRNPMASPDIIGISSGASLGAVIGIVFLGLSGLELSLLALVFALGLTLLIMLLSASDSRAGNRFILIGLALSALCAAAIQYLLSRSSTATAQSLVHWMSGSLSSASWARIGLLAASLALLLLPLAIYRRPLAMTALGDDLAQGLGVKLAPVRWVFLALAVTLTALATAATGPLAFVAFLAGPISRAVTGGQPSLPAAALTGAIMVVLADFAGANLFPTINLPAGVLTGALGAPALVWLLVRSQKEGSAS